MPKKNLDYLLIPDGGGKYRKEKLKRAKEESKRRRVKKILVMKGRDSEEDILYLGKILKKGDRIGFDTFPLHYKEYRVIIRKAKKEGKFPRGVKIENIKTGQNLKQEIYGVLGLEEEKLIHKKIDYMKNREDKFFQRIKNIVKRLLSIV